MNRSLFFVLAVIVTFITAFPAEHHERGVTSTCVIQSTNGTFPSISFTAQSGPLTVNGEGHFKGPELDLSLTVRAASVQVLTITGALVNGAFSATWLYGSMIGGLDNMTLIVNPDNTTQSIIDGVTHSTNGSLPNIDPQLLIQLKSLPDIVQAAIKSCSSSNSKRWETPERGLAKRGFGQSPRWDSTDNTASCHWCLAEATAASVACGVACGVSFGFACACVAGIPLIYANCHTTGTGLGTGCCPVGCGPSQSLLGLGVVYQCCYDGDTCLDSVTGACCAPGLQACGGNTCCPSSAPCRDGGICCPTNQNTCITPNGPTCCNVGESCVNGGCCPNDQIVNGQCCPPSSHTCCPAGSLSRCYNDGVETCVNNKWIFSTCPQYQFCTGIPVANAGVFCQGTDFCGPGEAARCYQDGVQTCVNGRWKYEACPPLYFCTHPSVAGNTDCYCQAPAPCGREESQYPSYCYKDGMAECDNGQWVFKKCNPPTFCLAIPVQGAGVACVGAPRS